MRIKRKYLLCLALFIAVILTLFIEITDKLSYQKQYPVSAELMWASVGNFASVESFGKSDLKFEFSGSGVGMTRTIIFPNGFQIKEKLEELNSREHILGYRILDNAKLPYRDYRGKLLVTAIDNNSCLLTEKVTYKTKLWQKSIAKKALLYFIQTTFENLEKNLKSN